MLIKFGEYYLRSDNIQYMLSKKAMVKGETTYKNEFYFVKLEDLLEFVLELKLRKSEATTLKQLLIDFKELRTYVKEQLKVLS